MPLVLGLLAYRQSVLNTVDPVTDRFPLQVAIVTGSEEMLDVLLQCERVDVNVCTKRGGCTALMSCALDVDRAGSGDETTVAA